jgi:hypothetical protein
VDGFWIPHILNRPKFPFVFFDFREKKDAMDAMLSLPQMKIAADTGKVICTEVIQFGVYPRTAGGWGFFIAGDQINLALYDTAVASCKRHNGKNPRLGDPPKGTAVTASNAQQGKASDVTFDREEKVDSLAQMKALGIKVVGADSRPPIVATKRHFKAPNKDAAMAYLKANPVDRAHYYLVVHTPNGVFGRDKDGIYEEQH